MNLATFWVIIFDKLVWTPCSMKNKINSEMKFFVQSNALHHSEKALKRDCNVWPGFPTHRNLRG
jgi:hypothetical protein